jgi:hypothetical protein
MPESCHARSRRGQAQLLHAVNAALPDLDALSNITALLEEPRHASAGRAQPLAERAMSELEAPHSRPALLGVVRGRRQIGMVRTAGTAGVGDKDAPFRRS